MSIEEVLNRVHLLDVGQPAASEEIKRVEDEVGVGFPTDYRAFLLLFNGGEMEVGDRYVALWPVGQVKQLNEDYEIGRYVPGLVAIGTDGGSTAYAFDYRKGAEAPVIVSVPLGDLSFETIQSEASSLADFLRRFGRTQ